jgi:flavin-dependent dehydrogenase
MPIESAPRYDALVVGARCAGAATAMLLARAGAKVLMVDWDQPGTDTLSTHALMRGAVMQLTAWGLIDRIVAAGTPAVRRTEFRYGGERVPIDIRPSYGVEALFAPRRTLLDRVLVEAAVAAGVEARFGTGLAALRRDAAGRVVGAMLNVGQEATVPVEAGIVIGADGRRSMTARQVGARPVRLSRHAAAGVYAYVEGLDVPGYLWGYAEGLAAGAIATNDGAHCVFANLPRERFLTAVRGRAEAGLKALVAEVVPELGETVAAGRIRGRPVAFAGQNGHMLQATGPGWALVGDAGYFKDPITAHGITDALRDAEILARAVTAGGDAALAGYGRRRDALSEELFDVTDVIASFGWTLAELQEHHKRLNRAMKAEQEWMLGAFGAVAKAA